MQQRTPSDNTTSTNSALPNSSLTNSSIGNTLLSAMDKTMYDNAAKKLLSEKILLARIMKECMKEYEDISVEEIVTTCINGTPEISQIPVEQDAQLKHNLKDTADSVASRVPNTGVEDASVNEGTVTYDIRFNAIVPTIDGVIRLIINLEAQNDYYPGYPLVTRGIYYGSRMISGQLGTVFMNSHYEKIEKVYSIWICTNPPKKRENTITSYRIMEDNIVGEVQEKEVNYDLLNVTMICLGDSQGVDNEMLKLLDVLLKDTSPIDEKKRQLSEEFHIPMTHRIESGVRSMCNLSDGIEQRGIKRGRVLERVEILRELNIADEEIVLNLIDRFGLEKDKAVEYVMGLEVGVN